MRKVIDSIVYDTQQAKPLATHRGLTEPDKKFERTLYKSNNGNYFFLEEMRSGWLQMIFGNGWRELDPITPEDAFKWLHYHNEIDIINEQFPGKLHNA